MSILQAGKHQSADEGSCLMEYVSILQGEQFSDHPQCVDEFLAAVSRACNDWATAAERDRLLELVPRLIGTASKSSDAVTDAMNQFNRVHISRLLEAGHPSGVDGDLYGWLETVITEFERLTSS